jgi:hypothetical protein
LISSNAKCPIKANITAESIEATALDLSRRFQERNEADAALMPPEQAKIFLRMIDEEDRICSEERQRNPDAFYRRLNLHLTSNPSAPPPQNNQRQGIGEMMVRTVVRATIWEIVESFFRR